jgi:drug/metabolite transporter (DMT)-like permease
LCTFGLFIWADRWKLGALALNAFKGTFATVFIAIVVAVTTTNYAEVYTGNAVWRMIIASLLGIVIADTWWLLALDIIGARKMIAVDSIKPFLSIGFGAIVLDQRISILGAVGVVVTTAGIVLVNLERPNSEAEGGDDSGDFFKMTKSGIFPQEGSKKAEQLLDARGIKLIASNLTTNELLSIKLETNATGAQSPNARLAHAIVSEAPTWASRPPVASRRGCKWNSVAAGYSYALGNVVFDLYAATIVVKHHGKMSVADVSFIRFGFGAVVLSLAYGVQRLSSTHAKATGPMASRDWAAVCFGIFCVTVITPMATTFTYFKLPLAIAVTLNSIAPLWSLPIARCYGEHVSVKAAAGACLATGGVVMLVAGA